MFVPHFFKFPTNYCSFPISRLLSETGRFSNSPIFVVGIYSGADKLGEGFGASLKMAEYRVSFTFLFIFHELLKSPGSRRRPPPSLSHSHSWRDDPIANIDFPTSFWWKWYFPCERTRELHRTCAGWRYRGALLQRRSDWTREIELFISNNTDSSVINPFCPEMWDWRCRSIGPSCKKFIASSVRRLPWFEKGQIAHDISRQPARPSIPCCGQQHSNTISLKLTNLRIFFFFSKSYLLTCRKRVNIYLILWKVSNTWYNITALSISC